MSVSATAVIQETETPGRWGILVLSALTNAIVVAAPMMSLSVLLPEITRDLGLTLVQAGLLWGIGALPGIITGLLGGALGDRFGPRPILIAGCLLMGVTGVLRTLAPNYATLLAVILLFGALTPVITMNNIKTVGVWFPRRELGLANGAISMGMALGFMLGALISATWLSPWLGGWRNVYLVYGGAAMLLALPWYFARSGPLPSPTGGGGRRSRWGEGAALHAQTPSPQPSPSGRGEWSSRWGEGAALRTQTPSPLPLSPRERGNPLRPILAGMAHVSRLGDLWLLGLAGLGISGGIQGLLGYLPTYLRGQGWPAASADGALSSFHIISMIFVLPIALWSDRLGTRKKMLVLMALCTAIGTGLLPFISGAAVWAAVLLAGIVRDGFMAIFLTQIAETPGVGLAYAGTAAGFVMIFMGSGNLLAPPLGNALAVITPGTPFLFWAALCLGGIACITRLKGAGYKDKL